MQPKWELNLGVVRGFNLPEWVIVEENRLRKVLLSHCIGPYNDTGTTLGLALYVEGDDLQLGRGGIKVEPFRKNDIGAQIHIRKADWDIGASAYRCFLWQQVETAINACVETLTRKHIELDPGRLRHDLNLAKAEFCGRDSDLSTPNVALAKEVISVDGEPREEEVSVVVQYQIEGHGRGSDHDKRAAVENLLGNFLEDADLGYCDGGDIGSGTMNVFCFVKPGQGVGKKVIELLRKNNLLDGATIAEEAQGEEQVIWPPDFKGEFQLI